MLALAEDWRSVDSLDAQERAMLAYAEKVTLAASTCTPDDLEQLRLAGVDDEEILEITIVIAYYNFMCRVADALGIEFQPEQEISPEIMEGMSRRGIVPS